MATPAQIKAKDQKWANKSWKSYLWMPILGTVLLIAGIICFVMFPVIIATSSASDGGAAAGAVAAMIMGILLMVAGGLLIEGGIALIVVTCVKCNKARERLGLPKR